MSKPEATQTPAADKRTRDTLAASLASLWAVIQAAHKLAPIAVSCMSVVVSAVVLLALKWAPLMQAVVLFIVFLVSLMVYGRTKNYGEAALALAAGLLSAYSVQWTPATFVSFVAIWTGFSFCVLLISSVGIAASVEEIYRQAAVFCSRDKDAAEVEQALRAIGEQTGGAFGPVVRAEILRLFVFRKIPLTAMASSMKSVEILFVVTKVPPIQVAGFIADLTRAIEHSRSQHVDDIVADVVASVHESAVPPADFLGGFEASRHILHQFRTDPSVYFQALRCALEQGVRPDRVGDYLEKALEAAGKAD